jgi:hypothetical protein
MGTTTLARIYVFPRAHAAPPVPSRAMERLGRIGWAAASAAYLATALLVAGLAMGREPSPVLLWMASLGFTGYAVWRLTQGIIDSEHHGHDREGTTRRGVYLASAAGHAAAGLLAAWLAQTPSPLDDAIWSSPSLLALAGAATLGFGVQHFWRAHASGFMRDYEFAAMSMRRRTWLLRLGQIGLCGRGGAWIVVAWLLLRLAETLESTNVIGLRALWSGLASPGGTAWPLVAVSLGLAAFAAYAASAAAHRRFDRRR